MIHRQRPTVKRTSTIPDGAVRGDQASDLQLLIDSTPSLIHTSRPDGYLDFFNQTWLAFVGRSLEDLQGWKWTAFIHPEDVEGIVEKWHASLASGEPFLNEARVLRADGEYRWMLHHKVAARYRLNVFPIEVPPLRERKDDILILVEYFVQRYANRAGRNIRSIDQKTLDLLQSYDWPGNIRELQNVKVHHPELH